MNLRLTERLAVDGYVAIERFDPRGSAHEVFCRIGAIDRLEQLGTLQVLRPTPQFNAPPNTYSGNFGLDEFPLHTDLAHWGVPPRFVALRNLCEDNCVPTYLADGRLIEESVGEDELRQALVLTRRPIRGRHQLLRLGELGTKGRALRLRWDQIYLRPASRRSASTFDAVRRLVQGMRPIQVVLAALGDTLIVDNWRMLHGRGRIPIRAMNRRLARCYLSEIYG